MDEVTSSFSDYHCSVTSMILSLIRSLGPKIRSLAPKLPRY